MGSHAVSQGVSIPFVSILQGLALSPVIIF